MVLVCVGGLGGRVFLFGVVGPVGWVYVGEDAVAELDLGEAGFLLEGDGGGGLEGLVDGLELVELVVVGEEADLGVVAGGAGGD